MRHALDDHKCLLLVLGIALLLDIWGVWWGLPNTASWDPDSSVPMTTLRGAVCWFSHGWMGQHQPLQPMLIAALCAPFFAYLFLTGGIDLSHVQRTYPWGLKDPVQALSAVILIGRLLSVASHLLLIWAMYRIGLRLRGRVAGISAAVLTALYYPFVYYAHVGNPDMLYMALMGVAVLAYLVFLEKPSPRAITWLAFWAALSASVKFQALPFFAGMAPLVLWLLVARNRNKDCDLSRRVRRIAAVAGLGVLVFGVTFAVANNWMFNFGSSMQWMTGKTRGVEKSKKVRAERAGLADTLYAGDPLQKLSFAQRTWYDIKEGLSLPVLVLAIGGLAFCVVAQPTTTVCLILPLLTYAAFYWKVHAAYPRYLFPMIIPVLLLAALGAEAAWKSLARSRALRGMCIVAALIIVSYLFVRSAALCDLLLNGSRYQVERWFSAHPQYSSSTVEMYQDPSNAPRLAGLAHVVSITPSSYFADEKNESDIKRRSRLPKFPESLWSLEALFERKPEFVVLIRNASPDNRLDYELERHPDEYTCVAEFGGPTPLVKLTFGANPPLRIYQRVTTHH